MPIQLFSWTAVRAAILVQESTQGGTPFLVPLLLIVLMLLIFAWGMTRGNIGTAGQAGATADPHAAAPSHDAHDEATAEPDDLKQIEGIGPKIEGVLNEAGITTFAHLAETEVARLQKIVREDAGITIAAPDTWPEQAGLAAAGRWDELAQLQGELKGGRRVS